MYILHLTTSTTSYNHTRIENATPSSSKILVMSDQDNLEQGPLIHIRNSGMFIIRDGSR